MIKVYHCTRDLGDGSSCTDFFRSPEEFEKVEAARPDDYLDSDLDYFEVPDTGTISFLYDYLIEYGEINE